MMVWWQWRPARNSKRTNQSSLLFCLCFTKRLQDGIKSKSGLAL